MITLITGAPGCGKSLILVDEFLRPAQEQSRRIVADGIPDLVVDHDPASEVSTWTKHVEDTSSQDGRKLLFTFPQGSLVVIDECQRIFRPRRAGSVVPPEVAAFETHRHQGLDFVLITQHPGLLDQNVRRLVGRHLHIRDLGFLGRWVYEWPEASDPERFKTAPVKRKWKLPKRSFQLYKSSSLHVKPQRGFPTALKVLALSGVLLAGGVWYAWQSIEKKIHPPPSVSHAKSPPSDKAAFVSADYNPLEFSMPRHPNYPESAPAYDSLRQVKNMPVIVGCLESKKSGCSCQTQTGTKVDVTDDYCHRFIENPPFDMYRDQVKAEDPRLKPTQEVPKGQSAPASTEAVNPKGIDPKDKPA